MSQNCENAMFETLAEKVKLLILKLRGSIYRYHASSLKIKILIEKSEMSEMIDGKGQS